MRQYYLDSYGADSSFIPYSGEVGEPAANTVLETFGLERRGYYLVVARLEPENNVDLIIREFLKSGSARPLVVVGGNPYATPYSREVLNEPNPRVRAMGGIFESAILNGLYENCYCYLHGHEVGGTNPSLLRAMQAGAPCVGVDVVFTREVLGDGGLFFAKSPGSLAAIIDEIDADAPRLEAFGVKARRRASSFYRWDAIADAYQALFRLLFDARRAGRRADAASLTELYRPAAFARAEPSVPR
ncbi:MAG: glycosyltransferase [Caulobacteraceae bacterium]|nr:glycosyltransferase [Caulobacteraceae bacterium]